MDNVKQNNRIQFVTKILFPTSMHVYAVGHIVYDIVHYVTTFFTFEIVVFVVKITMTYCKKFTNGGVLTGLVGVISRKHASIF